MRVRGKEEAERGGGLRMEFEELSRSGMRWVFLSLGSVLLAWSLLTVLRAGKTVFWKAAIVAGEFRHFLGIFALVFFCFIVAHGFVVEGERRHLVFSGISALMTLGAGGLFFSPAVFATMIAQRLPAKLEQALGQKPSTRRVFDQQRMFLPFKGVETSEVTTHVFAHAGTKDALRLDLYRGAEGIISGVRKRGASRALF